jgi:hypothetical protein
MVHYFSPTLICQSGLNWMQNLTNLTKLPCTAEASMDTQIIRSWKKHESMENLVVLKFKTKMQARLSEEES